MFGVLTIPNDYPKNQGMAAAVNVTKGSIADRSFREIVEGAESLQRFVVEAVAAGKPLFDSRILRLACKL